MKGDREQRRVVIRRLVSIREERGDVPNEAVDAAAHMLGLSRRQVRRLVATGGDGEAREPFDLTEQMIDFLFAARGNSQRAHERLVEAGVAMRVGTRQFQRAVEQRVDQALVAGARRGLDGVMAATVYLGRPVAHRNDIWAIDHTPAPVAVRPRRRGLQPYVPWVTTLMDESTGMWIAATVKNSAPNGADTAAVIAKGIHGFTLSDGTFVGGLPDVLLSDRGGDLMTDPVTAGLAKVLVSRRYTEPGSPWQDGKVERQQGLWQGEWCTELPGYLFGARFSYQRKLNLTLADPEALLFEDQFAALLAQEIERWNEQRLRKGKTPAQRWREDTAEIRAADPEVLRLAMLKDDQTRVVNKGTVEFDKFFYTDAALKGLHGKEVNVRYLPGLNDFIEIYYQGKHICQAVMRETLTLEQRGKVMAARKAQNEEFREHLTQGERLNAEAARRRLRALGYAEEDLPQIAGEQETAEPDRADEMPGQGDLLADLASLPDRAAESAATAEQARRAAAAAPTDDLDALLDTLAAPMPDRRGDGPTAMTGTGG